MASTHPPHRATTYRAKLVWEGNLGLGTSSYQGYERAYRVEIAGKPDLEGTADPAFRGDPSKHNPEDLFLAALAACHMLFYLALCARRGLVLVAYEDGACGELALEAGGGGRFTGITLAPVATFSGEVDEAVAAALHEEAHRLCFLANSCSSPIRVAPRFRVAGAGSNA
jgi:organic hydroperoxide reductase OsmC/OhrA